MRRYFRQMAKWWGTLTLSMVALLGFAAPHSAKTTMLTISQQPMGKSTCYIGAVEGDTRFDVHDLTDLGINSYRIFGGMPRWEPVNDSATYGTPTIDAIKANPDSINWAKWDVQFMQHQSVPGVSDATIFGDLRTAHIRPIVVLRNRDETNKPTWLPNPPTTAADWNEWWEHVFATVYWLNVRHTYAVHDFEVHDDPDTAVQGWGGTQAEYAKFVQVTNDAIAYVYQMYLPSQTYHLYAPDTSYENQWVVDALTNYPTRFDTIDYHQYSFGAKFAASIRYAHQLATAAGQGSKPLWISEWGTYDTTSQSTAPINDQEAYGVAAINNLIEMSQPGQDYVMGSDYYALYDTNKHLNEGLITGGGKHRTLYYALRLGIRALQGCKTTYQTQTSDADLTAITTTDSTGNVFVLATNTGQSDTSVTANLAPLMAASAQATLYRYDDANSDTSASLAMAQPGQVSFSVPPMSAVLVQLAVPTIPTPTVVATPVRKATGQSISPRVVVGAVGGALVLVLLGLWFALRRTYRAKVALDPLVARENQQRAQRGPPTGVAVKTPTLPTWLNGEEDRRGR